MAVKIALFVLGLFVGINLGYVLMAERIRHNPLHALSDKVSDAALHICQSTVDICNKELKVSLSATDACVTGFKTCRMGLEACTIELKAHR